VVKTNLKKVEEALEVFLRQMTAEHLLQMADLYGIREKTEEQIRKEALLEIKKQLLILHLDLQRLEKKDMQFYEHLTLSKKQVSKVLDEILENKNVDLASIKDLKEKLDEYKEAYPRFNRVESDEKLIEKERKKHINKRFNVNEKWLPLT